MKCPFCGKLDDKVVDSRLTKKGSVIRRRRKCLYCANRFTTYENIEKLSILVIKKDGRQEAFNLEKIKTGIYRALEKLDVSSTTIEKIVNDLEFELRTTEKKKIMSSEIGEKIMSKLHKLNHIAYVRFASVYREFKDVGDFISELNNLLKQK